jgi:hypothetical protein
MSETGTRLFAWIAWCISFGLLMLWSQPSARLVITLLVITAVYGLISLLGKE